MYYTLFTTYIEPHKSFEAQITSHQLLVHTYCNSYIPFLTTSYINAHSRATLADGFYVYTENLVLIWAYLHYNSINN